MIRKEKGITLIALVVTIVVLLILAGVSISLVLGDNGIISKAKDARDKYAQAEANDQAMLDEIGNWLEEEIGEKVVPVEPKIAYRRTEGYCLLSDGKLYSFTPETSNYDVDFKLTYVTENVKIVVNRYYDLAYVTKDGKLYSGEELIAEDVKEVGEVYYLTSSNELYRYNYSNDSYEKMADNVKKVYENNRTSSRDTVVAYLTNTNELYIYNYGNGIYEKVAENVKEFYYNEYAEDLYLSNTNELYIHNDNSNTYEKIGNNVKEFYGDTYLTNINELYMYNGDSSAYEKIADNVKTAYYGGFLYLTNINELYIYNYESKIFEKMGENVKEVFEITYAPAYLTNTNELYGYNSSSETFEKIVDIADNVKKFYNSNCSYLTDSNEIYLYNNNTKTFQKILENFSEGGYGKKGFNFYVNKDNIMRAYIAETDYGE